MLLLLFIIKTLVLTDAKFLKNRIKKGVSILPDDSKPTIKRPDLKPGTRKIATEDDDGHKVNILQLQNDALSEHTIERILNTFSAGISKHFLQVIVTAKFWFVSDLTGGAAMAEDQASKYIINSKSSLQLTLKQGRILLHGRELELYRDIEPEREKEREPKRPRESQRER